MSRTVGAPPELEALLLDAPGTTLLERLRSFSSDAPEDTQFQREILRLGGADRRVVGLVVQRILQIEEESGPEAAEAALEMLLRDLGPQRPSG